MTMSGAFIGADFHSAVIIALYHNLESDTSKVGVRLMTNMIDSESTLYVKIPAHHIDVCFLPLIAN